MADFFDTIADVGSDEEEDEDFDGEAGEAGESRPKKTNGTNGIDDSSEEEDDDDEDRLRQEGEGFIADEDDEEDEIAERKRKRRKRKKNREEEEALDDEDLDLIGVEVERPAEEQSRFKRLKRGHKERVKSRGVDDIFSDDEVNEDYDEPRARLGDEFDDFIEDDKFEDEIEDDRDVTQPGINLITKGLQAAGLDEGAEEDYRAAFGDGTDYDWALEMQEAEEDEQAGEGRELQLKDVFEPSQLQERMLTDEDNVIRETDIPERLQLARRSFKEIELTPEDMQARLTEEATWISNMLWPKKGLPRYFLQPFEKAVRKVLEFINLEDYEVPFIFNHRKDYLIHAPSDNDDYDDIDNPPPMDARPERLLNQADLWEVFEFDLKFRAFAEKRDALRQNYENLKSVYSDITDTEIEELTSRAITIEEIQELQDYLHYKYSQEINEVRQELNGTQKRANNARSFFDKLRGGKANQFVKAIGITPEDFAKRVDGSSRGAYTIEDPPYKVEELADQMAEAPETGATLLRSTKLLFVEDLKMCSRLRRYLRGSFYQNAQIDCIRTDKGMRKITEDHPYYEFKYLHGVTFSDLQGRPDLFLKMLKAEAEGLVRVKISMGNYNTFKTRLEEKIISDGVSDISDTWNNLRKELLGAALGKLQDLIANGVKETLRARCEDELAASARENYYNKLDQAPYKLKSAPLGSVPNVLCLTNGKGQRGDAIMWAYVENDGRVLEHGRLVEMRLGNAERGIPEGQDIEKLVDVIQRRRPDVIGVSGFAVETRKLYKDIQEIISQRGLTGPAYEDEDTGEEKYESLEVIMVNDEVARLYHTSARAVAEFPKYPALTRYCVALGRYLQNPLAEYASLGKDIVSIPFIPNQTLIPQEKLLDRLETAMVDMVNLVGIDLPETYDDKYLSKLIPYVCGLGPRKADRLIKAIQANSDEILSRFDLLGVSESRDLKAAMGPKVFQNCASFLYIPYDSTEESSDYLDYTRVHPEDYDLARKMVADALNMDEEDVKAETDEGGPSAVVRKMVREETTDLVNDLALEDYANEIEKNFGQRKRATLETIRAELDNPYEEIRQIFALLSGSEMFTMLTGETEETLYEGMVVPVPPTQTLAPPNPPTPSTTLQTPHSQNLQRHRQYITMDRLTRMLAAAQGGMGGMGGPQGDTNLIDNSETVYISSLALLKMLRHGRAGVPMEVMGLMLGEFVDDYTVRVVDVFAMPQSGTGVSVEAVDPVFQTKMMDMLRQTGRQETVVGWYHSHPGFGCWLSSVDINTQQSFEQLTPRAVAVVVDPIQSVKGKVVIDAFRLINPQALMMGHEPRQTTSNVGHLNKPSIQALIHGLNRHYYSIGINYRKTALEENMLMNLHKHVWTEALLMDDFKGEGERNTDKLQKLVTLADGYEKRVKEETELTKDQLKTRYVGKVDPKKHISDVGQQLIEDNIVSVSRQMIDKEASVPKSNSRQNGNASSGDDVEMEE